MRAVVHVHVDAAAYERGHLEPGERCEVAGSGPITVSSARAIATGGTIKVVESRGKDVQRVAHLRRTIPAHVRSAVDARYPKCAITACPNRRSLDYDHRVPLPEGGETSIRNLWRLCSVRCHFLKTHRGWVPVLRNGAWELIPPSRAP